VARTIRFHLDENCDPRIAVGLRLHGIDVTTTSEARPQGASDERQLAYAIAEGRVIVTRDADFLRLDTAGTVHNGII
jgi:predicted nuclease of predicted toxin-antitoxin system